MNSILLIVSAGLIITGIIGSFLPIIPGPITSWLGLLAICQIQDFSASNTLLTITFIF